MVAGAAEVTNPRGREHVDRPSDIAAGVQILRGLLGLDATAFQQDHAEAGVGKLTRESNSRHASADDADLGFHDGSGRHRTRI
jgi:hypothetical protein